MLKIILINSIILSVSDKKDNTMSGDMYENIMEECFGESLFQLTKNDKKRNMNVSDKKDTDTFGQ